MRKLLAAMLCVTAACGSSGGNGNGDGPQTVATPAFSQAGGTFSAPLSVTITCATAGATIRFTTDGSTPGATSTVYAGPVAVATTGTTLKAYATRADYTDSAVASATYVLQAATPTFTPGAGTYAAPQSVVLATATPGAAIHYTADGTPPTASSPTYTAPISVSTTGSTTIRALAIRTGFADSAAASATYVINPEATPTATPTFSPLPGTFTGSAPTVTLACATAGATIYYTTNGTDPTTASAVYAAPFLVPTTTTVKAMAVAPGHTPSAVASGTYTIVAAPQAAAPTFDPPGGTYASAQSVVISSTTPGAVVHYTSDGSTPTPSSTTYAGPVAVAASTTLKAITTAAGYTASPVSTASYVISAGGTDFATLCAVVATSSRNLMADCLHWNPAVLTGLGEAIGIPCAEIARHFPSLLDYDPIQGQACRDAFLAMTCADLSVEGGTRTPAACDAAITGKVAAGGTCHDSVDCAAGFCTVDFTLACPGTCQAFAGLNQGCASAECADGLVCDSGTCRTAGGPNDSCPCGGTLWCDDALGAPGTCKAPQTAGSCDPAAFGQCAAGYVCVDHDPTAAADFRCAAMAAEGGSCALGEELCGLGYACSGGATPTCVAWPTLGQSCATLPLCAGAVCNLVTQTCEALKGLGAPCSSMLECASGNCNAATNRCTLGYCVMP